MRGKVRIVPFKEGQMKSYTFKIRLEEDGWPDGTDGYFVCVPELEHLGAATHGKTKEEALKNIQEVLQMIIDEFVEEGKPLPIEGVMVSEEPLVTVTA
jgi:predicted RNase H-like HicB family nuclease